MGWYRSGFFNCIKTIPETNSEYTFGHWPLPRIPVANKGLGWDSLLKMVHNPGGHWHPGKGPYPKSLKFYGTGRRSCPSFWDKCPPIFIGVLVSLREWYQLDRVTIRSYNTWAKTAPPFQPYRPFLFGRFFQRNPPFKT